MNRLHVLLNSFRPHKFNALKPIGFSFGITHIGAQNNEYQPFTLNAVILNLFYGLKFGHFVFHINEHLNILIHTNRTHKIIETIA